MNWRQPEPLNRDHLTTDFSCGIESLDSWLKRRALANQTSGATRTFVASVDGKVVGYYALASGGISTQLAVGNFRRNMPDPVPVIILARLAIDSSFQGQGLGRALFRDAALRVVQSADTIGIRGIIVHAISAAAKDFYVALGFDVSPLEPMTLMVTVSNLRELMDQQEDIYQGKLGELKQAAQLGLEAAQSGEVVEGSIAMEQIRANLKSRYSK
jgi:predicted N-acetyltransferase YhbS